MQYNPSWPAKVRMTEVGVRDGLQIEPEFIPTSKKIELVRAMVAAGMPRMEITSFVSPRAVPQMADAADLVKGVADLRDRCTFAALVPNLKGVERAIEAGIDEAV